MLSIFDSSLVGHYLEGFLFGIYTGIFVIYLQCPSRESRTAKTVFYLLSLLYVLSMATVVADLLAFIFKLILPNTSDSMISGIETIQITVNGSCDPIAQCILIYRCWIVWGKDIRVVIIPSILAFAYIATWLAARGALKIEQDGIVEAPWGNTLTLTGLATSMAVNALVTGLIVFKILRVSLEYKPTSVERTLGSTGGTKLQHIIFIIIESGMVLFAIQLVRVIITTLLFAAPLDDDQALSLLSGLDIVLNMHQVLNGIAPTVILVRVLMNLSFDDEESFKEAAGSLHFNNLVQGVGSSGMESNEDICLNNSPSHVNSLGGAGGSAPQERSEDIDIVARAP